MRIAATSMTPIQVIESLRTKLQSIGISSFMQVNFESANSKVICESESDACLQRVSETGKRLRRVTGGAPPARRHSWRLADTKRGCSSERLRTGKKGETSERPSWAQAEGGVFRRGDRRAMAVRALLSKGDTAYCSIERADQQSAVSALRAYIRSCQVTTYRTSASCAEILCIQELASK